MGKKKKITIAAAVLVLVAVIAFAGVYVYVKNEADGRFFDHTTVNGYTISGKTMDRAVNYLKEAFCGITVDVTENGQQVLAGDLEGFGYTLDEEALRAGLQTLLDQQNSNLIVSFFKGNTFTMDIPYKVDETVFDQQVCQDALSVPRVASVDAVMENTGSECQIIPETYGNEFADSDLQDLVKQSVDAVFHDRVQTSVSVEIPQELYILPAVTQEDPQLVQTVALYNQFSGSQISYVFGSQSKVLDWTTFYDWIEVSGDSVGINEEKAYNYVVDLANAYDTIYSERSFTAHDGRTITLPSNDYGYRIDKDGEYAQLIEDLYSGSAVEREPVYSITGYARNGRDDLNGTYIEADLTSQHLWFYKDGVLIIDTDFVSGLPKDGRETTTGAFPIPYKASPFNLSGGGGSGSESWDVDVQYWMPFYDGQGLHDASWRSTFGGSIYLTDGSHGCINLPTAAAKVIYDNLEANMPILLYK